MDGETVVGHDDFAVDEWDGVVPDPYDSIIHLGAEFIHTYTCHMQALLSAIATEDNPEYDMRFQMQCDDCQWAPCNVTTGFEGRPCHRIDNARRDGFYVGKF